MSASKFGGLVLLLLALAAWPAAAPAASCSIVSPPGGTLVDFGAYNALDGHRDSLGQMQVLCVPDLPLGLAVPYTLSVGPGLAGTFNPRQLRLGASGLDYNLYRDVSRTQVLGDGSAGTSAISGSCAATCGVFVYGRLFGGQLVPGGQYSDTVLVTLEF